MKTKEITKCGVYKVASSMNDFGIPDTVFVCLCDTTGCQNTPPLTLILNH